MMAIGLIALLVFVTMAAAGVAGIVGAHRRAQAAADLAALAGAGALQEGQSGGSACDRAVDIAERNEATIRRCEVRGEEVQVLVEARTARIAGSAYSLSARAHAGPAEAGLEALR